MNLKSKLGQMFFIGISGTSLTSEEKDFIVENDIGGIILFCENFPLLFMYISFTILNVINYYKWQV